MAFGFHSRRWARDGWPSKSCCPHHSRLAQWERARGNEPRAKRGRKIRRLASRTEPTITFWLDDRETPSAWLMFLFFTPTDSNDGPSCGVGIPAVAILRLRMMATAGYCWKSRRLDLTARPLGIMYEAVVQVYRVEYEVAYKSTGSTNALLSTQHYLLGSVQFYVPVTPGSRPSMMSLNVIDTRAAAFVPHLGLLGHATVATTPTVTARLHQDLLAVRLKPVRAYKSTWLQSSSAAKFGLSGSRGCRDVQCS